MSERRAAGRSVTWYGPERSVCSKWNWLTPPAAWSLVGDGLPLGRDDGDRSRRAGFGGTTGRTVGPRGYSVLRGYLQRPGALYTRSITGG